MSPSLGGLVRRKCGWCHLVVVKPIVALVLARKNRLTANISTGKDIFTVQPDVTNQALADLAQKEARLLLQITSWATRDANVIGTFPFNFVLPHLRIKISKISKQIYCQNYGSFTSLTGCE